MSNSLINITENLATHFGMNNGDGVELVETLKSTAFKGNVTNAQMTALMVVANQYKLNPFTKEIYAFPDKNNGIVPVVGVDGWSRIINTHPQFDGIEFEQDSESCSCIIYRKDRSRPIKVTEWMDECSRQTGPWKSHPKRMLRHKAMIQCARLAFGYVGIYDQDEAEKIVERDITSVSTEVPSKATGTRTDSMLNKLKPTPAPEVNTQTGEVIDQEPAFQYASEEERAAHIIKMIQTSQTQDELTDLAACAEELPDNLKPDIRKAYAARVKALKAA